MNIYLCKVCCTKWVWLAAKLPLVIWRFRLNGQVLQFATVHISVQNCSWYAVMQWASRLNNGSDIYTYSSVWHMPSAIQVNSSIVICDIGNDQAGTASIISTNLSSKVPCEGFICLHALHCASCIESSQQQLTNRKPESCYACMHRAFACHKLAVPRKWLQTAVTFADKQQSQKFSLQDSAQ